MISYLVSKDSKNKIRCVILSCDETWDNTKNGYIIKRETFQFGGKHTQQPDIVVDKAKQKRSFEQQLELEYNSNKKKYLDKGYKLLEHPIDTYTTEELDAILGELRTNQDGIPKPMLAKQADKVTSQKTFDKLYWGSPKIDGLRCLIYMDEDGKLKTSSRGATNYNAAMSDILEHPDLIKVFNDNPGLIMDGECYKHGLSLQDINSVARTQVTAVDYTILQFYWYDIVDVNAVVEDRINKINDIAKELNLSFDPNKVFEEDELRIQIVPQYPVSGYNHMLEMHNNFVSEGWEGLVVRLSESKYGPNKRTNDMIKLKCYKDAEFEVIGYELGLRGSEDMVFNCITPHGKEFKAKPYGDRDRKQWYVDNFEKECLHKMATVKYFYYSDNNDEINGVPLQPSLVNFRIDL